MRTPGVASEYLIGVLTSFIGPHAGCSTSVTMPRARTIEQVNTHVRNAHKVSRLTMLVVQRSLDIINSSIWHPTPFKNIQPLLCSLLSSGTLNHAIDLSPVLHSVTVSDEAGIRLPLREAQSITQHAE